MKIRIEYIEALDQKFPCIYDLNVVETLQNKYGTIEKFGESLVNKESKVFVVTNVINGLKEIINEGIDYENYKNSTNVPFVNKKTVGRIISEIGIGKAFDLIVSLSAGEQNEGENQKN